MINKFLALSLALGMMVMASPGSVDAQVAAPRVAIQLAQSGLTSPLTPGASNAVMARLILDTTNSSEAVRINSLPFQLAVGGGGSASTLQSCAVYNEASPTIPLSAIPSATSTATSTLSNLVSGLNTITLTSPLILAPNTVTTVALRCNIGSDLVAGATYTFSMNTANLAATGVTTGTPAIVTVRGSATPVTPVPTTPTTPGLPATGAGGDATSTLIILGSLALAGLGITYAKKQKNA